MGRLVEQHHQRTADELGKSAALAEHARDPEPGWEK